MRNQGFVFLGVVNVLLAVCDADGAARVRHVAPIMTLETSGAKADQITFTGRILDTQGQPVCDARILLYQITYDESYASRKATLVGEKVTGADGAYAFAGPRESDVYKESYILVQKQGLALGWAAWQMRGDQQADVTLGEPKELAGAVIDENGKPLAGADVSVAAAMIGTEEDRRYLVNWSIASDLLAVKTDAAGRFVFSNLPAEATCELVAKSPGRALVCTIDPSYRGEKLGLAPGKAGIKITLPPEATIRGAVVTEVGDTPVAGIKLLVQPEERGLPLTQEPIVSAADGGFSFGSLAAGRYTVQLLPSRGKLAEWIAEPVAVNVTAGETKSGIKVELAKGGIIEVMVKEDPGGKPVDKVNVSVRNVTKDQWFSSPTGEDGLAQIRVAAGPYQISGAYKQGYTRAQGQLQQVEINDGETKRLEYTLTPAPRIAGVVRDEAGNPLAGVKLEIKPGGPEEKTTASDGTFEISWDPSNWGSSDVTFILVARDPARNLAATVDVDDQTKNLDLKLKPGIVFTGKVLNHEGKPLAGARMQIMLRAGRWGSTLGRGEREQPATAPDGTFEARGIPPERLYSVTALAEGYGKFQVEADTSNAKDNRMELGEFKLPLADQSISGVVVDANDKPVANARVYTYGENQPDRQDVRTDKEGKFIIKNVCAGPMRLSVNVGNTNRLYGSAQTEGGATDVRVVVSERSTGEAFVPRRPQPLAGKPLPDLKSAGIELPADANDRMLLVCLWDMNQRPSRYCVSRLVQQVAQLGEKGVAIVALQAAKVEPSALSQWTEKNKPPFPVGCLADDVEKARFAWGVVSLPHLILTNKKHVVAAEGFGLSELDAKIETAASQ